MLIIPKVISIFRKDNCTFLPYIFKKLTFCTVGLDNLIFFKLFSANKTRNVGQKLVVNKLVIFVYKCVICAICV